VHDAISQLRQYRDGFHCPACGLFELASAYDRVGQTDSALVYYASLANTPAWGPPAGVKLLSLAQSYKRLGELYEQKGDRADALQYYGKFVDLWKNADPELQPAVRDVNQRMARLAGEK
jgi:tetratricopeptide (TPR) repeat protein